jgi:hypothetical protein
MNYCYTGVRNVIHSQGIETMQNFSKTYRFTYEPPPFGMIHRMPFGKIRMDLLTEQYMDCLLAHYDDLNYFWIDSRSYHLEIWANTTIVIETVLSRIKKT